MEFDELGVTRVLAHSEKAAAYMADGYARVAGMPGVCMAQSVGAANLASGLQDAWLGRTPVVALTGRKEPSFQHRNSYQEIPHAPLFAAVTKFSAPVDSTAELPRLLRHAWRAALADPPRPTHLDFCGLQGDVIELGQTSEPVLVDPEARRIPAHRPVADAHDIERAAAALKSAGRVVIVAGDSASSSQAGPELLALAEALAAPIATSLGARGIVSTRHPLHVGVPGSYSAPPANRIVHSADLVLYVGCDTGDQVTLNWTIPPLATKIVQIDADPLEIGRSYPNTIGVVGDPKATLARLAEAVGRPARDRGFAEEAARIVADWRATMKLLAEDDRAPIRVERLCAEVTKALPADGILVADTGYSGIWTGTMIDFNGAGQTYLRAAGSLGWSFPAALGAQCAAPDRNVLCFTGDGGFYYHLAELEFGAALRHPGHRRRQQQFGLRPEPHRRAAHCREPAGPRRGAGAFRSDRLYRGRPQLWRARHPRRASGRAGIGVERSSRRRRAGRGRRRDRSRTARPRAVVTASFLRRWPR